MKKKRGGDFVILRVTGEGGGKKNQIFLADITEVPIFQAGWAAPQIGTQVALPSLGLSKGCPFHWSLHLFIVGVRQK